MSQTTPIVAFEIFAATPWWDPDPEDPPPGAVIVADMISRFGGTERQGWAFVYACADPDCGGYGCAPLDAEQPTRCPECSGPLGLYPPAGTGKTESGA